MNSALNLTTQGRSHHLFFLKRNSLAILGTGLASATFLAWAAGQWIYIPAYLGLILAVITVSIAYRGYSQARQMRASTEDYSPARVQIVHAILDSQPKAQVLTDMKGQIFFSNKAYGRLFPEYPPIMSVAQDRDMMEQLIYSARVGGEGSMEIKLPLYDRMIDFKISAHYCGDEAILWDFEQVQETPFDQSVIKAVSGEVGTWLSGPGIMLVVTNNKGQIIEANSRFAEVVGLSSSDLKSQKDDLVLSNFLSTSQGDSGSVSLYCANGKPIQTLLLELPIATHQKNKPDHYLNILLFHNAQNLVSGTSDIGNIIPFIEAMPNPCALTARDGRLIYMNKGFREAASMKGHLLYPSDMVLPEDAPTVSDAIRRVAGGRSENWNMGVRLKTSEGDEVVTQMHINTIGGSGEIAALILLTDNREQRKLEQQVAQATKMQAVGQLAGGVAHDFNNILTAIIGYCDLILLRHSPGDADFGDLNQIRQNANRAANLVRQLLAFSRQQTLRPQVLQVTDVISELSHLLKRLLGETIQLEMVHGRNLDRIRVDPGQLEQVIVNLAINARDAMPQGGRLLIKSTAVDASEIKAMNRSYMPLADYIAIIVSDTGAGIPDEYMSKIFEPFFTTKDIGKGTGLGLSTVYGIVKQTGGFIFAHSEVGKGTTFTIYLPVHTDGEQDQSLPALREPASRDVKADENDQKNFESSAKAEDEDWGGSCVLVVEDEPMVRAVAQRVLNRRGYDVLTADNGEEALAILGEKTQCVDLLISDVVMPVMDGPALVASVREKYPDLKVIFMSGYAEEQLRNSIDIENVNFLPKPFSVQQLDTIVKNVLKADA